MPGSASAKAATLPLDFSIANSYFTTTIAFIPSSFAFAQCAIWHADASPSATQLPSTTLTPPCTANANTTTVCPTTAIAGAATTWVAITAIFTQAWACASAAGSVTAIPATVAVSSSSLGWH